MPGRKQYAGHNDYVKLEALVESGKTCWEAAQQLGLPLSAFKSRTADPVWYEQIKEREETCRAAMVDKRTEEIVARPDPPQAIFTAWQKANHPGYREKTQIEVTGSVGHEVEMVVTLGDILKVERESQGLDLGLGPPDQGQGALPGTPELLPAPAEREAGSLPPEQKP